jgi:prepilin-type N-terminal cleavage/methylation domain-containing protein
MRRRQAFTLVEMLVTIALVTFIMALLTEAFIVGVKTFRDLKALGDMDERLRAANTQLQTDSAADHFEGKARLGDPNFWASGPPSAGFFRIYAPSAGLMFPWTGVGAPPASYFEGADGDGIPSAVVTDTVLHFSVKLRGNQQDRFFTATNIPPGSPLLTLPTTFVEAQGLAPDSRYQVGAGTTYNSQWAEVAYFLIPNGDLAGSTPLFTLYRTQLVVVPDNTNLNWPTNPPQGTPLPAAQLTSYMEMSCQPDPNNPANLYFNNPSDLAGVYSPSVGAVNVPPLRAFIPTNPVVIDPNTGLPRSSTFVLGDVISFEVQALVYDSTQPSVPPNPQYVSFDTGAQPPQTNITIRAIQITLRVWDSKTQLTRQITIVQDL